MCDAVRRDMLGDRLRQSEIKNEDDVELYVLLYSIFELVST